MINKIYTLDATLRDGGFLNNWLFEEKNIINTADSLLRSNMDFLEGGLVSFDVVSNKDFSIFHSVFDAKKAFWGFDLKKITFMIDLKGFDKRVLEQSGNGSFLRLSYYKKDIKDMLFVANLIKERNYDLFLQTMVTNDYSKDEFVSLIKEVNRLSPFAFYIVDSFGSMDFDSVKSYFLLADEFLSKDIKIGFHLHDNLGKSADIMQKISNESFFHDLIFDSCILGIGRGGGNADTKKVLSFLNKTNDFSSLEQVEENVIKPIVLNRKFPKKIYELSAKYKVHPYYAEFFFKNNINEPSCHSLYQKINECGKNHFDLNFAENLIK